MSNNPHDLLPTGSLYRFALIAIGIESEKWAEVIANKWIDNSTMFRLSCLWSRLIAGSGKFDVFGLGLKSSVGLV
jgi:hypothetical protein